MFMKPRINVLKLDFWATLQIYIDIWLNNLPKEREVQKKNCRHADQPWTTLPSDVVRPRSMLSFPVLILYYVLRV